MFAAGVVKYLDPNRNVRGLESICIRRYSDGVLELYAKSSIFDVGVERAVVVRVDAQWRPLWSRVNTWQPGQLPESMEILVDHVAGRTEVHQWGGLIDGHRETVFNLVPNAIGAHPVAGDCWSLPAAELTEPGSETKVTNILMTTMDPRGGVPMEPVIRNAQYVRYLGPETVTVQAGTFQARVYELGVDGRPPERIVVQGDYFGLLCLEHPFLASSYELASWVHFPHGGGSPGPQSATQ